MTNPSAVLVPNKDEAVLKDCQQHSSLNENEPQVNVAEPNFGRNLQVCVDVDEEQVQGDQHTQPSRDIFLRHKEADQRQRRYQGGCPHESENLFPSGWLSCEGAHNML